MAVVALPRRAPPFGGAISSADQQLYAAATFYLLMLASDYGLAASASRMRWFRQVDADGPARPGLDHDVDRLGADADDVRSAPSDPTDRIRTRPQTPSAAECSVFSYS
jgi:hypothetical protein